MPAVDSVHPWKKVFIRYCLLYYLVFGIPSCYSVNTTKLKAINQYSVVHFVHFKQLTGIRSFSCHSVFTAISGLNKEAVPVWNSLQDDVCKGNSFIKYGTIPY